MSVMLGDRPVLKALFVGINNSLLKTIYTYYCANIIISIENKHTI